MSIVCIGDIHGSLKAFKELIAQYPEDQQFCLVGDLIDRGPNSVEVIEFVMNNSDRIKCVRGNHEDMMYDFYRNPPMHGPYGSVTNTSVGDLWLPNGGKKVHAAYKYKYGSNLLEKHLDFIKSLPYFITYPDLKNEKGQALVVSHSVMVDEDFAYCAVNKSCVWGRHFPEEDRLKGKWFNIFGHTPVDKPVLHDWFANIDCGAVFKGGSLVGLKFPEMEITAIPTDKFRMEEGTPDERAGD